MVRRTRRTAIIDCALVSGLEDHDQADSKEDLKNGSIKSPVSSELQVRRRTDESTLSW